MTRIFAIVGPSGAGKDTLISGALAARPDLRLVRRVITRPEALGGEDFEGITEAEFTARKAAGEFALDWRAHGLAYGIPTDQITGGADIMFNGSRAALPAAMERFPGLHVVVITAPGTILGARLAARGREEAADVSRRLARAAYGLPKGVAAQVVVNDGSVAQGVARLLAALQPDKG